jgi:hypothetical protein
MNDRKVVLYCSWSRPGETGAPLGVIDNRFPALFESRRFWANVLARGDRR